MRKITYFVLAAITLGMVACTPGYVVTGTAEGATDGDTILLQEVSGRQLVDIDTAVIANGTFQFKGARDSVANIYLSYPKGQLRMDFFLENGEIKVALTKNNDSATGTPANDAYQEVRGQVNVINEKASTLYASIADTTLTEEQRKVKINEMDQLEKEMTAAIAAGIEKNSSNLVGLTLFKQHYFNMEAKTAANLISKFPAAYLNEEAMTRIKDMLDKQMQTAEGKKFVDFEMLTTDGKPMKLSDYAGKGKVVLVDFWASWCGPCRAEMPKLVEAYQKFKGDKFEIVGVSLDKDAEAWKTALEKMNMTWPQMSDLKYWNSEGAKLYGISSIPHTVLIGEDGTIIARGLHGDELLEKLTQLVPPPALLKK